METINSIVFILVIVYGIKILVEGDFITSDWSEEEGFVTKINPVRPIILILLVLVVLKHISLI